MLTAGTSRLHELHVLKLRFVSRIEFIRSKLPNCSAHVSWIIDVRHQSTERVTSAYDRQDGINESGGRPANDRVT